MTDPTTAPPAPAEPPIEPPVEPPTGSATGSAPGPGPEPVASADGSPRTGSQLARWYRGLGRGQQVLVAVLAAVLAVNLALAGARSLLGSQPGGPTSSSFSTGADGLEAYADLLRADGRSVVQLRRTVTADDLPAAATAVVVDPSQLTETEAVRLARFVARGGRLVIAGEASAPLVGFVTGSAVGWDREEEADELAVWLEVDGTGSARRLAGDRGGRWSATGPLLPVAGADDRPAVVAGPVGAGHVVALADSSLLQNANLARADNAALALGAAGGRDRPVVFVESVHGYAETGLAAVPSSWKWMAAGLGVALLAGLWSAGTRLGPPEPQQRALRPPRRAHVEAIAAGLDQVATAPAAAEPLRVAGRAALTAHLGIDPGASTSVLARAAEDAGIDARDVAVLDRPAGDLDDARAIGALSARRQRARHQLGDPPPGGAGTVPPDPLVPGAHL